MGTGTIRGREFESAEGTGDWRVLAAQGVAAWFAAGSHQQGARLLPVVVARAAGRPVGIDLRVDGVQVWLPDEAGLTTADVALARDVSAAAGELGLAADPTVPQSLGVGIETADRSAAVAGWQPLLGYQDTGDLVDPLRRDPRVRFATVERVRPLRNRIHLDLASDASRWSVGSGLRPAADGGNPWRDPEGNEVDLIGMETAEQLGDGCEDWRLGFTAMAFYPVTDPERAQRATAALATVADEGGFPLLIDLRPAGLRISSAKDHWEDPRFAAVARRLQATARDHGLRADPEPLRFVQLGIDAHDVAAVRAFWCAALGYETDPRPYVTDINDPHLVNPPLFFQSIDPDDTARRAQRNRIHLDLVVPDDQVRSRVDRALAAGGRIADDGNAPCSWTVADPEGNELDIATALA